MLKIDFDSTSRTPSMLQAGGSIGEVMADYCMVGRILIDSLSEGDKGLKEALFAGLCDVFSEQRKEDFMSDLGEGIQQIKVPLGRKQKGVTPDMFDEDGHIKREYLEKSLKNLGTSPDDTDVILKAFDLIHAKKESITEDDVRTLERLRAFVRRNGSANPFSGPLLDDITALLSKAKLS